MKKLNPKSRIRLSAVVCMSAIALSVTLFTSSCQKDDSVGYDENKWDAYEYLDISDEIIALDVVKWSAADIEILRQSEARLTFKRDESGLLYIEEKSAEEVNISPKLYAYSQRIVDNTNRFLMRKAAEMKFIPLSKSSSVEEGGEVSTASDCVAQTLAYVLSTFGITVSASDINSELEKKYGKGKGVPASEFIKVVQEYLNGEETTVSNIPSNYSLTESPGNVYLIAANIVNMGGHAAPLVMVSGDWLLVKDIQNINNGNPIKVHKEEVLKVYKSTGSAQ